MSTFCARAVAVPTVGHPDEGSAIRHIGSVTSAGVDDRMLIAQSMETGERLIHPYGPRRSTWASLPSPRRVALGVLVDGADSTPLLRQELASAEAARELGQALVYDQVDQLFLDTAVTHEFAQQLPAPLLHLLGQRRLAVTASVIRQEHVLDEVSALLDGHDIAHVVLKGALVRRMLYAKPHLRPSVDVDLLIARPQAPRVARLLGQHGFALRQARHWDTHEACLSRHGVDLDLHWNLLRPGRMRHDITAELLAGRIRRESWWSPSDPHLTAVMLIHSAITDHVTGPLISAVDLDRWLRRCQVRWHEVIGLLERMGLRTAAWTMLHWTRGLLGTPVPDDVVDALAPSIWRQKYLEAWLDQHPARRYGQWPNLVRGGFSLALQDRVVDVARALWRLLNKDRLSLTDGC